MSFRKPMLLAVCLAFGAALAQPALAQPATGCTSSQAAVVQCFVSNAVATKMTVPRYGMTLAQFQTYGVAVSQILQTHHTYLVLVSLSGAVADAMPPTNANGSANQAAQDLAVTQSVSAATTPGLVHVATGFTLQDCQWFALDVTGMMNNNNGYMTLLTPGVSLRLIDSYVVTSTSNGVVNWNLVNSGLSKAINNLIATGLVKVPAGVSTTNLTAFVETLAHIIDDYKVATGRKSL